MTENELQIRVENMCQACAYLQPDNGVCSRPWVRAEGQKTKAVAGVCIDFGAYDTELKINLGTRLMMPKGRWVSTLATKPNTQK